MLNEEFKRMQKLAGILKEARFTNPGKEQTFYTDARDIDFIYNAVVDKVKEEIELFDKDLTKEKVLSIYLEDTNENILDTVRQYIGELMVRDNVEVYRGGQEVLVTYKNIPTLTKEELADFIAGNTELYEYLRSLLFLFVRENMDIEELIARVEEDIIEDKKDDAYSYRDDPAKFLEGSIRRALRNWSDDYIHPWYVIDENENDFEGFVEDKLSKISNIMSETRFVNPERIDRRAKILSNISGEQLDSKFEFMSYINDYYNNYEEYDIDPDSEYYKVIKYAVDNPADAWDMYTAYWDSLQEVRLNNPDKEPDIEILRDIYYYEDFGKIASGYLSGPRERVWQKGDIIPYEKDSKGRDYGSIIDSEYLTNGVEYRLV